MVAAKKNTTADEAEALEAAYWTFDARRAGTYTPRVNAGLGPQEERDAFKAAVREHASRRAPPVPEEFGVLMERANLNAAQRDSLATHLRSVLAILDGTGGYTTPEQQVTIRLARLALEESR